MLAILSPAKRLDYSTEIPKADVTTPDFLDDSQKLINKLQKLSKKKISSLMSVSADIASLNHERYAEWALPMNPEKTREALFMFDGEGYRGFDPYTLTPTQIESAKSRLRILSGLYGVLKPFDPILPYRLEMGTRFGAGRAKNLYEFWKTKITDNLNEAMAAQGDDILVNSASNEYFKAVDPKKIKGTIIDITFKEFKDGEFKSKMTFAKMARGMMARYVVDKDPKTLNDLMGFDYGGYMINERFTEGNHLVFTRDQPAPPSKK